MLREGGRRTERWNPPRPRRLTTEKVIELRGAASPPRDPAEREHRAAPCCAAIRAGATAACRLLLKKHCG